MKFISFLFFIGVTSYLYGQETYPFNRTDFKSLVLRDYNHVYDSTNHDEFYKRAKFLVELNNPDSSYKATRILWGLLFFDTSRYSIELYEPLLKKIEQSNRSFFLTELEGKWTFEWSGSNWGTVETSKTANRTIVFTDKQVIFYSGDTIKRRTEYRLVNSFSNWRLSSVNNFQIEFFDSKEKWKFHFYSKEKFVPYIGKTKTKALLVNQDPLCVCGCPEEVYSKTEFPSYVKRK